MAWMEKRAEFKTRFDALSAKNINALVANLDAATAKYISKGGLSQNQDPNVNPDSSNTP